VGSDGYTISEPKESNQFTGDGDEESGGSTSDLSASDEEEERAVDEEDDDSMIVFSEDVNANVEVKDDLAVASSKGTSPNGDASLVSEENGCAASPANLRAVYHRRDVTCSADRRNVTVNDLRVEVRSDRPGCRALVPVSDFSDPRQLFRDLMSGDCDLSPSRSRRRSGTDKVRLDRSKMRL
jgi:hypothetical protein